MHIDLTPATTLLLEYQPNWAYTSFGHTLRTWIADGCDLERDIVPALEQCMKVKKDIKAISYFYPAVIKRRDARIDTEQAQQAIAEKHAELASSADARRANHIAFLTRKLGKFLPHEQRWLAEYEAMHGTVAA